MLTGLIFSSSHNCYECRSPIVPSGPSVPPVLPDIWLLHHVLPSVLKRRGQYRPFEMEPSYILVVFWLVMDLCVYNHTLQKAIYLLRSESWMKVQVETIRFRKQIGLKYTYQNNNSGVPEHRLKWEFTVTNMLLLPVVWTLNPTRNLLVAIQLMSYGHNLPCQITHTLVTIPHGKIKFILSRKGSPSRLVFILLEGSR